MNRITTLEQKIERTEAELQRSEAKYPLYAKQLRTKLARLRLLAETARQEAEARAELARDPNQLDLPTSDNFADGGRADKKKGGGR